MPHPNFYVSIFLLCKNLELNGLLIFFPTFGEVTNLTISGFAPPLPTVKQQVCACGDQKTKTRANTENQH